MKKQNFSKKREAILEAVKSTKSHPSAEMIYNQLKPEIPDLSLATVYRNLKNFKDDGTVASIGIINGHERFDGDITPHSHFACVKCGTVYDVDAEYVDPEADTEVSKVLDSVVLSHSVTFWGLCKECKENK